MIVTKLKIANLRAIESAELFFQPGFNLIVGVNGVGKTSMLDALRVSLSDITKQINNLQFRTKTFKQDDIRVDAGALTVECNFRFNDSEYGYLIHKPNELILSNKDNADNDELKKIIKKTKKAKYLGNKPSPFTGNEQGGRPLAVLFSTNRAVPNKRAINKNKSLGGISLAYTDAFTDRTLNISEFAIWMDAQITLSKEGHSPAQQVLVAFEEAIIRFLPGYKNLHLRGENKKLLWIEHNDKPIPVWQLSDGERGILALVLDLTRKLTQANPEMKNPISEAEAVVLIDEIDLHLHPKWQRNIVDNLCTAFPKCQFIVTTHSPQIIGEVNHQRIQIIADGKTYSPQFSYGVDSSRVLEEIMDTDSRSQNVTDLLTKISQEISNQEYNQAKILLTKLSEILGDNDSEVIRIQTLLDFLED